MCAPCTPARNSLIIWEPGIRQRRIAAPELAAESCARPLTLYVGEKGAYDVNIAPDLGRSTAIFSGCSAWHPEFCFVLGTMSARRFNKRTVRPSGELVLPSRSFRMTDYPRTSHSQLTEESVMGIIAWIVLGLAAGLLANMLIPGRRSQGLIVAGQPASCSIFTVCKGSSTCLPGSPRSSGRQSCCSCTTWSREDGPAGSRTGERRQGCSGSRPHPWRSPTQAQPTGSLTSPFQARHRTVLSSHRSGGRQQHAICP